MNFDYNELLIQGLNAVLVFLPASIGLALAGLPFMAIFGQILAKIRQRSFYDKCGRQLARLSMWLGFFFVAGSCYEVWPHLQNLGKDMSSINMGFVLCLVVWAISWFFSAIYFATWTVLKNFAFIHRGFAFMGAVFAFCGLYGIVMLRQAERLAEVGEAPDLLQIFMPPTDLTLLIVAVFIPPLIFSLAGGFGAVWLVLRRGLDDFGRDYYNLMAPWCAAWARNSWFIVWLLMLVQGLLDLWLLWDETGGIPPDYPFRELGMFMVLWFIPVLLWHIVIGSQTPLRHKLAIFIAPMMVMGFLYVMLH